MIGLISLAKVETFEELRTEVHNQGCYFRDLRERYGELANSQHRLERQNLYLKIALAGAIVLAVVK